MSEKNMTLMMEIKAKADQAMATIGHFNAALKSSEEMWSRYGTGATRAFNIIGSGASIALAPMKLALQGGLALAGSMIALGSASIFAAAGDEKLVSRLTAVYGSGTQAKTALDELDRMSMKSGKSTEDLADAMITLQQYGLSSSYNLTAVANAAKVADVSVADMAMSVSALQSRGLKKLGIGLEGNDKDGYTISGRDKSGKLREVIVRDAEAARKKLIDIFSFKFGTDIKATTFSEMFAGLKNGFGNAIEQFGDGLLPAAKRTIEYLSTGIQNLIEGGKLDEWGKKAGEWLEVAASRLIAGIKTLPKIWEGLQNVWEKGGDALRNVLLGVFEFGAGIFSDAFVGMLQASAGIWAGIGEIIASMFMKQILQLFGMDNLRQTKMNETLGSLSKAEYSGMATKYNLGANTDFQSLPVSTQTEIAMMNGSSGKLLNQGIANLVGAMPGALATAAASGRERLGKLNGIFQASSGVNVSGEYNKNLQETERSRLAGQYAATHEMAYGTRVSYVPRNGNPRIRDRIEEHAEAVVEKGLYKTGDVRNGWTINIGELKVVANNDRQMADTVLRGAGMPALAGASF